MSEELARPIAATVEEVRADLHTYAEKFPKKAIPHVAANDEMYSAQQVVRSSSQRTLNEQTVSLALKEIQDAVTAKLVSLVAHLCYWNVFAEFSSQPLDDCHISQLFVSIQQVRSEMDFQQTYGRVWQSFIVPMLLLAVRMETELIFKNTYPLFFSIEKYEKLAMKFINDFISELLDPNLYLSRFSFLESGRDAITIKQHKAKTGSSQTF